MGASDFRAIKSAVSLKHARSAGFGRGLADFRAIKSAVSLKRHNPRVRVSLSVLFPRHQKRGLIEARRMPTPRGLPSIFPRHQKRGLIEASGWRSDPTAQG